ncbi:MAG: cache domain-containing protein [Candidatus Muiribacteriaceae bacterium]
MKRLLILIILIAAGISWYYSENLMREKYSENLTDLAGLYTASVRNEIIRSREDLETVVKFDMFREFNVEAMRDILTTLIQKNRLFKALYIIDRSGKESANITEFSSIYLDRSSNLWFSDVIKGSYSGFISEVNFVGPEKTPSITSAVILRDSDNDINGLIAAEIDLSYLFNHLVSTVETSGISRVMVLSANDRIIFDSSDDSYTSLKLDTEILKTVLEKNDQDIFVSEFSKMRLRNTPDWKILYLLDRNIIYRDIYFLRWVFSVIGVLLILMLFFGMPDAGKKI